MSHDRIQACVEGIKACLRDRKLKVDRDLVVEVGFTILEGRAGLRKLLAAGKLFTALACTYGVNSEFTPHDGHARQR